jgi:hypothetical protein
MTPYFISKEGKIYKNGKEKKLTLDKNYLITNIDGKKKLVHRLVAETYLSNPENKKQVNHKNGDKLDNRVENLEWTTPQENLKHRDEVIKTCIWGEKAAKAKFTNEQAKMIREEYKNTKTSYQKIAKKYGVYKETIARIVRRETFSKYAFA